MAATPGSAWIRRAVSPCTAPIWPREVMDSVVLACRDLAKKLQKQSQQKQQKDTSGRKMDRIKAAYDKMWKAGLSTIELGHSSSVMVRNELPVVPGHQHVQSLEAMHQPFATGGNSGRRPSVCFSQLDTLKLLYYIGLTRLDLVHRAFRLLPSNWVVKSI